MQRVKRATVPLGKKTELSRLLKVPLSQVSGWLSGVRNPSGETTLQLLEWVAAEEAKQKSPGTASTAPERQTRGKASREKKPTSGRRKK
jgi:hypothetical protein